VQLYKVKSYVIKIEKSNQELNEFKNASCCVSHDKNIAIISHCLQYVCWHAQHKTFMNNQLCHITITVYITTAVL